ncbi:MAG TPA: transaldolase [Solirubrobacteraceae bacterium]|nr:transaldolase [Solirubrobacteraceae bacterium]
MTTTLHTLAEHGQSPWLDYLSRPFVRDGDLARRADQGISGVTSNPTIFQGAISDGDAYDEQIRELRDHEEDPKEIFLALAAQDIRDACDVLRPVFDRGEATRDGWVSLEVDPTLAHDAPGTVAEAKRIAAMIERPNLFVKIPGTREGLEAIEETIAAGIPVNVTLLFSLQRHREAAEAYLAGLRRLRDSGGDLRSVASVASFFVSRVDTEVDRRLDEIGGHDDLKGKLAVANAKLAYQTYQEVFQGAEWDELVAAGASPQRCLWASTSVKNPAYPDLLYVESLIGPQTVNTMPQETVDALIDHGTVTDSLTEDLDGARATMERLAQAGVDYDDVVAVLEREGVQKFADSFAALIEGVADKRRQFAAA